MTHLRLTIAALAAVTLVPTIAHAQDFVDITANTTGQEQLNNLTFPTGAIDTTPGATGVYIAELSSSFNLLGVPNQTLTGFLNSRVYRNTNGLLDFFYQVVITETTGGVTTTNLSDYTTVTSAAAFDDDTDIDGGGVFTAGGRRPFAAQRINGGAAAFTFNSNPRTEGNDPDPMGDGSLTTGSSSAVLGVRTNAITFTPGNGTINGGAATNAPILAPGAIAVVPEAGTLALLVPGVLFGAIAVVRRRK